MSSKQCLFCILVYSVYEYIIYSPLYTILYLSLCLSISLCSTNCFHDCMFRRFFKNPIHNNLVEVVINRVKCMLGYPESSAELVYPPSVLYRKDDWGMGKKRSYTKYLEMVGLDMTKKVATQNTWCHRGEWPDMAKEYLIT